MQSYQGHQLITLLKEGYIFQSVSSPKTKIIWKDDRVLCSHNQWFARLSLDDFIVIYAYVEFLLLNEEKASLDLEKDHEFYLWKQ